MHSESCLIAMSGGVDSSVAAFLMAKQYRCVGVTMRLCDQTLAAPAIIDQSIADARQAAERLGMDFHVLEAAGSFKEKVVAPFITCYEEGLTPNPCITCNQQIKFGILLDHALAIGCSHVVTGHYAKIRQDPETGRYLLYKAEDEAKDQSYFLAGLSQQQLSHIRFPLGELTKAQVREIAQEQGFLNARKRDSQDICFIPDGDYVEFMKRYTGKNYPSGDFLDLDGKVVGKHSGAFAYTLGQRKGLGIALGKPAYVCRKDMEANTVTVGPNEALFSTTLLATNWNWLPFPALTAPIRVTAKARYRHTAQPATVYPEEDGTARVVFDEPQRAITPGQAVVLYDGNMVVGAGTIREVKDPI